MKSYLVLGVVLAATSAAVSRPAMAQESSGVAAFTGHYTYVARSGDVIGDAIERGIADMNFVTRPIARRRLRNTNQPYRTIHLNVEGGTVATAYDGRDAIVSPADGSPAAWSRDGEPLTVTTALRGDTLVQTFAAEDGTRENAFTLSADGRRLTLQVTVRSPRLPEPIVYRLTYDRAG